jgi:hypothetical protein
MMPNTIWESGCLGYRQGMESVCRVSFSLASALFPWKNKKEDLLSGSTISRLSFWGLPFPKRAAISFFFQTETMWAGTRHTGRRRENVQYNGQRTACGTGIHEPD